MKVTLNILATPLLCWGICAATPAAATTASALVGKWQGNCTRVNPLPLDGGVIDTTTSRATVTFTVDGVLLQADTFQGLNCAGLVYQTSVTSDYAVTAAAPSPAPALDHIDYILQKITITLPAGSDLADLNDITFCGYRDWAANVAKDVTGRQCFDNQPAVPATGAKLYDLVSIEGGKLRFGLSVSDRTASTGVVTGTAPVSGTTPATRPTTLSTKESFDKAPTP